jgi:hypothetical protein
MNGKNVAPMALVYGTSSTKYLRPGRLEFNFVPFHVRQAKAVLRSRGVGVPPPCHWSHPGFLEHDPFD